MKKQLRSMSDLMATATPTTAEPVKAKKAAKAVEQQQLVVQLPSETLRALKLQAIERNSTVRAMLLEALEGSGYPVPAGQAVDFRRVRRA